MAEEIPTGNDSVLGCETCRGLACERMDIHTYYCRMSAPALTKEDEGQLTYVHDTENTVYESRRQYSHLVHNGIHTKSLSATRN